MMVMKVAMAMEVVMVDDRRFFCRFRHPGAFNRPQDRQKTDQDEKPVLGQLSRSPGAAY